MVKQQSKGKRTANDFQNETNETTRNCARTSKQNGEGEKPKRNEWTDALTLDSYRMPYCSRCTMYYTVPVPAFS